MKDLSELIIEMDKSTNEQIAAGLSEDEKNELLSMLKSVDTQDDIIAPCNNVVPFDNCVSIPNRIQVSPQAREFVFESCLTCTTGQPITVPVTPDNCPGTIMCTLFPIKIVGCIQYIAIADVKFNSGCFISLADNEKTDRSICPTSAAQKTGGISAQGSICVDTIVGYTSNPSTCSSPIPCEAISVCLDPFTVSDDKILFSGKFILPSITNCGNIPSCSPTTCPAP